MNDVELRAVLDWWMCSDPWPQGVPETIVDDWLDRECRERGYDNVIDAFHKHLPTDANIPENSQFGVGA